MSHTLDYVLRNPNDAAEEIDRLREFVGWVDAWTSNEVGSYSIYALDGLFGMTRDRIAALQTTPSQGSPND